MIIEEKHTSHKQVHGVWEPDKIAEDGKSFRPYKVNKHCDGFLVPGLDPRFKKCLDCCYSEGPVTECKSCGKVLGYWLLHEDCGGDCLECMARAGDPQAINRIIEYVKESR